jgi:L-iditol 2-dehydrogenase
MKSMKLTGILQMKLMEVSKPEIKNDNDVLIKMKTVGICGSDVHYYTSGKIGSQVVEYPFTVGHEGSGVVEAIGKNVKNVKPGDRIAIEPAMHCGECDQCKAGRPHTCRKLNFLGCPQQVEGCLAEYIVLPEHCCLPIPGTMTFDQAAISEPLAIGLYAVKRSIPMPGATIGILGAGPIGESVLLSAIAMGAKKAFITDKIDERLVLAKQNGAFWTGNPDNDDIVTLITGLEPLLLDVVFECCGQQEALDQAIDILKPGGKLMIIGIPTFDRWSFSADKIRRKEICIQNVRRQNNCTQEALDLMSNDVVNVDNWVTHRFKLDDAPKAFDLVTAYKDGVLKAMIDFE